MTSDTEEDGPSHSQSGDSEGEQDNSEMVERSGLDSKSGSQEKSSNGQTKVSVNIKDPSRPRRKKARRACYACQRAHLTCGDERPCQRCIKRGLQDACQDGVRKKAKYLHDAPTEALMPGAGASQFQYINTAQRIPQGPMSQGYPSASVDDMYSQQQQGPSGYSIYPSSAPANQMPVTLQDSLMSTQTFAGHQAPLSPPFQSSSGQPTSSLQTLVEAMQQNAPPTGPNPLQNTFTNNVFDANDLTQYNFDPASFNFGNHYGALEFGMLGHMSSGAANTPPSDTSNPLNPNNGVSFTSPGTMGVNYGGSPIETQPFVFNQDHGVGDWRNATQSNVRQSGAPKVFNLSSRNQDSSNPTPKQEPPDAFSIGAGPTTLASPASISSPKAVMNTFDTSPSTASLFPGSTTSNSRPSTQGHSAPPRPSSPTISSSKLNPPIRRRRDPSAIYNSVTQPYSYTTGFHSLTAFLQRRFSPQKTLRIAKALASIRPSFISCTKTLDREDLIFMEKCFQRTLCEYEDFISAIGTPTIVCRRTGEVAAVGKEFSILTGWRKDVLLGKEANLNVNTGGTSGQPGTGSSSRGGMNTPRFPEGTKPEALDPSRPQPVFLAELFDDDSVVAFYEDFARLAFGDSRGSVTTRCKLLKYKTKEDPPGFEGMDGVGQEGSGKPKRKRKLHGRGEIAGEAGIEELADKDGKVDCSCCWTIKRDLFDIPMMIVMNFLPCI